MSLLSDIDRSRVSVLLDLRHPLAYLALYPAIELAASAPIDINWLPLTTPTLKPPSPERPDDDRGVRHRRFRAEAISREIETYSAVQGLEMQDWYRSGSAAAANLGWLWVRDRQRDRLADYLTQLFRLYWSVEIDASSIDPVASLLDSLGADGPSFRRWTVTEGATALTELDAELRARGLYQVPTFVVDDEVFIGRQHLPMIDWMLHGRSGPVPI